MLSCVVVFAIDADGVAAEIVVVESAAAKEDAVVKLIPIFNAFIEY